MANNCSYNIRVVAKDAEAIKRVFDIMRYKDKEFYLYRVFSVEREFGLHERPWKGGFFYADFFGDVAWGCDRWINDNPDMENKSETGAHYSTFVEICKALSVGVEIFAEEEGCGFQEHFIVNHDGEVVCAECANWTCEYDEDTGERLSETGGVKGYMEWSDCNEIYGEEV